MEKKNIDKPGYKEIFAKNYLLPVAFCLGIALLSFFFAAKSIIAGYGQEYGIDVGMGFIALAAGVTIYGWIVYRKDFKGEIRRGERDGTW